MDIWDHKKMYVLKLVMSYLGPKDLVRMSAINQDLQGNAASLFRVAARKPADSSEPADLDKSFDTVKLWELGKSADFSDIGRLFFHIPMQYLRTVTTELDFSGTLIDGVALRVMSKWCTELLDLKLQRCEQLDNDALDPLKFGFPELQWIDLSDNSFIDKQTLRKLLRSGLTSIRLVGWQISQEDESDIREEFLEHLPFVFIYAKGGERVLEIKDDY